VSSRSVLEDFFLLKQQQTMTPLLLQQQKQDNLRPGSLLLSFKEVEE